LPAAIVRAATLASALALAAPAHAFCRTTTASAPPGYDPVDAGCWTQGAPIGWTAGRVAYALSANASRQVSLPDATRVAHLAFDSWNAARCPGGASPDVQTYDDGPVDIVSTPDCGADPCGSSGTTSRHAIVFDDDGWPHNDPANTLALTTITFGSDSGVILDARVEVNTYEHALSAEEPPPPHAFDLQAILTHEAGHFLGLAHATDERSIMYAFYRPGAIELTQDDVDGLCAIYPPAPSGGCSCRAAGAGADVAALGVAGGALVALLARRRARRA